MKNGIPVEISFAKWRQHSLYEGEFKALEEEFSAAAAQIDARLNAKVMDEKASKQTRKQHLALPHFVSNAA